MKLTTEQRHAVLCDDEDVMLTACPGSGKTRVIISKLLRAIDAVRGTPRAVACITYTNAGVHEIETRLRHHIQPGDELHFEVGTIHSFCLNHIFRPFCHLIDGYGQGFTVLTPDSPEFEEHVTAVCADYARRDQAVSSLDVFGNLRISTEGVPVGYERSNVTAEMALAFWKRIREAGFIDFASIIYHAYSLVSTRPELLSYVTARFAWILVDEFQDTTDLQVELLLLIAASGRTRFLLVGDPLQSIYSFSGARPDLAEAFAARIGARTDLTLSGNFRSSAPITDHANRLYARTPSMAAVGEAKAFTEEPMWHHGDSVFDVITDHFLPALDDLDIPLGEAAILARTWFPLYHLGRGLRDYGVSIVGPGARPYRRKREFAQLAEQACGYIVEPRPEAIAGIERTLFNTLLNVTGRPSFRIFSYAGRVTVFRLLHRARELRDAFPGAVAWLEAAAADFTEILIAEDYLTAAEGSVFLTSVEHMKEDMKSQGVDLPNLAIEDLGIYASPEAALTLSTIHNAKGREYQAVALIQVHDGSIPFYQAKTAAEIEEEKRVFYVAITRAKRLLFYVTDTSHWRNTPSRFLGSGGLDLCTV